MDEGRVNEIEDAVAHAVAFDKKYISIRSRNLFSVRMRTVAFKIIEEEGCASIYEMSDRWGIDRTSLIHTRKKGDRMMYDPPLRNAYLEATRYLGGVPTPHVERLMRIRGKSPKPNKGSYRYKDIQTGLIFNGGNEVAMFFGCSLTAVRGMSIIKNRLTTIGKLSSNEIKAKRIKHLPTGEIYDDIERASSSKCVPKSTILGHIYGDGRYGKRQWRYV